jgi:hypothetical protein
MTPQELERLERLEKIVAGNGIDLDGDGIAEVFGAAALKHADDKGWSAFLGVNLARQGLASHENNHPGTGLKPGTQFTVEVR